jgi:polyisoprenoid-binding protein YceI
MIDLRPAAGTRAAAAMLLLLAAGAARAEPARYALDPDHLSVGFLVHHVGYAKVLGMFRTAEGAFTYDEASGALSQIEIKIDTASLYTNHKKRDEHLRSADFLNSKEFPSMRFSAASARRDGERGYVVDGELELLGVRRPVTLRATRNKTAEYPFGGGLGGRPYVTGVSIRGSFKRSEFGMRYGVDNDWVGDEVELIIEFEAQRQ